MEALDHWTPLCLSFVFSSRGVAGVATLATVGGDSGADDDLAKGWGQRIRSCERLRGGEKGQVPCSAVLLLSFPASDCPFCCATLSCMCLSVLMLRSQCCSSVVGWADVHCLLTLLSFDVLRCCVSALVTIRRD